MVRSCSVMVHPLRGADLVDIDQRHAPRQPCQIEATSRPMEPGDGMAWGGMVKDLSAGGLKLSLCFPFGPGTFLAVELQSPGSARRALVCRVVHVHDDADGTWTLGCEFIKPLSDSDVEMLI